MGWGGVGEGGYVCVFARGRGCVCVWVGVCMGGWVGGCVCVWCMLERERETDRQTDSVTETVCARQRDSVCVYSVCVCVCDMQTDRHRQTVCDRQTQTQCV